MQTQPAHRDVPMPIEPVTLTNEIISLVPLSIEHASDLTDALDEAVFAYMPVRESVRTLDDVERYIEHQLSRANTVVFAVIDHATGKAIGSTSYMNIRAEHYGVEIGSTWITKPARGTAVNPSMKYLMLKHAFEDLGAIRVELKTDARNTQSRAAILKLGAQFEGIMRHHIIMPDGFLRDTVLYSITPDDWATIKPRLEQRITTTR